jgi:hypothetical protein
MINKRGSLYAIIGVLATVVLVMSFVFMFILGGSILNDTMGQIFTEVRGIGNLTDNVNVNDSADMIFKPVENVLGNFAMYGAMLYVLGIVLIFTLAFVFRGNISGWTIALFVVSALLIIIFAIILSNTYEAFYLEADDMGTSLRNATLASWLILHSPVIMTIVIFLAGIIMMTGKEGLYP